MKKNKDPLSSSIQKLFDSLEHYCLKDPDDWVELARPDLSQLSKNIQEDIPGGKFCLAWENQKIVLPETQGSYIYLLEKIINQSGIEDATKCVLSFIPNHQKVVFHRFGVYRNGRYLDKLATAHFQVTHSEREQVASKFQGYKTLAIFISDVQVGDEVECSYTIYGADPALQNHFHATLITAHYLPILFRRIRIVTHQDKHIFFKNHKHSHEPIIREATFCEHYKEYVWDLLSVKACSYEEETPRGYFIRPYIEISDYKDWSEVIHLLLPYFKAQSLPSSLDEFQKSLQNRQPEEIVLECLNYTQKRIRYHAFDEPHLTYKPFPLDEILANGFGDCKDKTLLFVSMLQSLKIEAHPALVSTQNTRNLKDSLPSTSHFDHIICYVKINHKEYWLDPTFKYQEGIIDKRSIVNEGCALILEPSQNNLTLLPRDTCNFKEVKEIYDFRDAETGPIYLTVRTTFKGYLADNMRQTLQEESIPLLTKRYTDFYKSYFDEVTAIADLKCRDDREHNILLLIEKYEIKNTNSLPQDNDSFYFNANDFNRNLTLSNEKREHPLGLFAGLHIQYIVEIIPPEDKPFTPCEDEHLTIENSIFYFRQTFSYQTQKLTYFREYKNLTDEVPPDLYQEYRKDIEKVCDLGNFCLYKNAVTNFKEDIQQDSSSTSKSNLFLKILHYGEDEPNRVKRFFKKGVSFLIIGTCVKAVLAFMGLWKDQKIRVSPSHSLVSQSLPSSKQSSRKDTLLELIKKKKDG